MVPLSELISQLSNKYTSVPIPFKPMLVDEDEWGSVTYFLKDRPSYAKQVDGNLWIYYDFETKEIVGVRLFGAMARPDGAGMITKDKS